MRKPTDLDRVLENAVASALGLDLPHPEAPRRVMAARTRPAARRRHMLTGRRGALRRLTEAA
ncbi:MAG TPA: hypothetical protein VHB74_02540 [Devosia sp.]|nr:hypothetical protein [Devosia sp.]